MNKLLAIAILLGAGTIMAAPVVVLAHGKDPRGGTVDVQMKKLHAMMPMFSVASAELEAALDKNDAATATVQAEKIKAATPDLKKSRPHKNIKQRKQFVEVAVAFDGAVDTTIELIKRNDISGAKNAFKKVEEVCAACHAKFRD